MHPSEREGGNRTHSEGLDVNLSSAHGYGSGRVEQEGEGERRGRDGKLRCWAVVCFAAALRALRLLCSFACFACFACFLAAAPAFAFARSFSFVECNANAMGGPGARAVRSWPLSRAAAAICICGRLGSCGASIFSSPSSQNISWAWQRSWPNTSQYISPLRTIFFLLPPSSLFFPPAPARVGAPASVAQSLRSLGAWTPDSLSLYRRGNPFSDPCHRVVPPPA